MGAWGTGILEDDTALDFLAELRTERRPLELMRTALADARGADYLETDLCNAVLVSAAILDAVDRGAPLEGADAEVNGWIATLDRAGAKGLRPAAAAGCRRLLAPGSELQELWAENEEDYPRWREQVEALAARLAVG